MPKRDADILEVLIGQMAEYGDIDLILSKALSVLPETARRDRYCAATKCRRNGSGGLPGWRRPPQQLPAAWQSSPPSVAKGRNGSLKRAFRDAGHSPPPQAGANRDCQRGDTTMKNALVLIALTLAIIAGTAAEAVETHQAVVYAATAY